MLLFGLPVLAAAALGTLLSVGWPILFRQPRFGRDGREFQMLKFRTMRGSLDGEPMEIPDLRRTTTAPGGIERR